MGTMLSFQSVYQLRVVTIGSISNIGKMIPTTQALLISVVFVCWLEEAVLSRSGHCAGNVCSFQVLHDFQGAKKVCEESSGQLLAFSSEEELNTLTSPLSRLTGMYWLRSTDRAREEAAEGVQKCSAISVTMGRNITVLWGSCRDELNGFLCQYHDVCSRLQSRRGAQVTYSVPMGFEMNDSETFPMGTIAVAWQAGSKYPDSKHLCFSASWMRAPWKCEVLGGGCEPSCSSETDVCVCPAGHSLHPNNITCTKHPCADCAQGCQQEGDSYLCKCDKGYRLAQDAKSCVDVNECEEENPCTAEGQECVNMQGVFDCSCKDGFLEEDGVCINVTICEKCEHMDCRKFNGVYQCVCRKGFRVSPTDPTKCEQHCTERDCLAKCIPNPELERKGSHDCFCPDGYVKDIKNSTVICTDINECEMQMCDHKCENVFGDYRCLCNKGFKLQDKDTCVPLEEEDEEYGSGSTTLYPTPANTPASVHPVALPSYIKTGSILGITVFMLLCTVLLYFLVRRAAKRCNKFELSSFKHPEIDIFYLQQVTTESYKRLSFDKPFKNDSQRL